MPRHAQLAFLVTIMGLAAGALAALGLAAPALTPPAAARPAAGVATVESLNIMLAEGPSEAVDVIIRGTVSDSCTEIDAVRQRRVAAGFQLELTTRLTPAGSERGQAPSNCLMVTLPFQHIVRLSTAELPAGVYAVVVNGRRAELRWPGVAVHPPAVARAAAIAR